MCTSSGDDGSADIRKREEERQARIKQGMASIDSTFSQFDDPFFDRRRQAYVSYAMPQVENQYTDALTNLTAALARSGLMQSSVAARKGGDLTKQYSLQRQNVVDQGLDASTQARRDIENSRSGLVSDLYATADPAAAAAGAAARAKIATQQPSYSPLGMLFQNAASGLADYSEGRMYNRAFAGAPTGGFNFGGSSSSGKVIGGGP